MRCHTLPPLIVRHFIQPSGLHCNRDRKASSRPSHSTTSPATALSIGTWRGATSEGGRCPAPRELIPMSGRPAHVGIRAWHAYSSESGHLGPGPTVGTYIFLLTYTLPTYTHKVPLVSCQMRCPTPVSAVPPSHPGRRMGKLVLFSGPGEVSSCSSRQPPRHSCSSGPLCDAHAGIRFRCRTHSIHTGLAIRFP